MALQYNTSHTQKIEYYQDIERMVQEAKNIGDKIGQVVEVCLFILEDIDDKYPAKEIYQ